MDWTYTIMFKIDPDEDIYEMSLVEYDRFGRMHLVNNMTGTDVIDIYENTTGKDAMEEDY